MPNSSVQLDQQLLHQLLDEEEEQAHHNRTNVHLSDSDKVAFLLNSLEFHMREMQRREEKEQTLFEWCTNLLLITFGAIVALSGQSKAPPFEVKSIASVLIGVPTSIFIYRILIQRSRATQNARIAERIREIFHVYDKGYYTKHALYPPQWKGTLPNVIEQRKTPLYFSGVLLFMAVCVIGAIWRLL